MTDPTVAMTSFISEFRKRRITLEEGRLSSEIFVYQDTPAPGVVRFSYVSLLRGDVSAFVTFVMTEPLDGVPCFQIGYAVPTKLRGKGLAAKAITLAVAELSSGLSKAGVKRLAIEAIVGVDNAASIAVANKTLGPVLDHITDEFSGQPAMRYLRHIN